MLGSDGSAFWVDYIFDQSLAGIHHFGKAGSSFMIGRAKFRQDNSYDWKLKGERPNERNLDKLFYLY